MSESTLRNWRRDDPEFASAVLGAIDECLEADGQAAASFVREHIEALREGRRQARQVVTAKGDVVEVLEPIKPESSLIQAALRRWDSGYRAAGTLPAPGQGGAGGSTLELTIAAVLEHDPQARAVVGLPPLEGEAVPVEALPEPAAESA